MATITEDFVSFETARLLKEKGFDKDFDADIVKWYNVGGEDENLCSLADERVYKCPSLAMMMKWLRDIKNIHIVVHPYTDKEGHHFSFLFDSYAYGCWQELGIYITDSWNTYEQAAEAAIKYCLDNLIE